MNCYQKCTQTNPNFSAFFLQRINAIYCIQTKKAISVDKVASNQINSSNTNASAGFEITVTCPLTMAHSAAVYKILPQTTNYLSFFIYNYKFRLLITLAATKPVRGISSHFLRYLMSIYISRAKANVSVLSQN